MTVIRAASFTGVDAWDSLLVATMGEITTRIHWTNRPFRWHVNEGQEVFVVLTGQVEMFYLAEGEQRSVILNLGDLFYAKQGTQHSAHPRGEARVLVVESAASV